jgi:polar amino acid transport system substrate-binding protein
MGALAVGVASLALLVSPLGSLAQDASTAPEASMAPAVESMAPAAESMAPVLVSEACQAAGLEGVLQTPGRLTISTDNPAFAPWWAGTVPDGSEWASFGGYPPSGEGYESAMAYAIAAALGFSPDQVDWVGQSAFGLAFKPGPKDFDFHLGQVSYRPKRAERVDFSDSYFDVNQGIVALADNPINEATSLADLKAFRLGAPVGTTSLEIIETLIQPDADVMAYKDVAGGKKALANGRIDGLVVDLPTAFYIRDAELNDFDTPEPEGSVAGQIATDATEYFGMVLEKDSPLTACVNEALALIKENGTWQAIYDQWISEVNSAPFFE